MFNNLLCNHTIEDMTLLIYEEKLSDEKYFPVQIFHFMLFLVVCYYIITELFK